MNNDSYPFERYLNIRSAYQPSFSFDGQRLAFLTNVTGIPQVWAIDVNGGLDIPLKLSYNFPTIHIWEKSNLDQIPARHRHARRSFR